MYLVSDVADVPARKGARRKSVRTAMLCWPRPLTTRRIPADIQTHHPGAPDADLVSVLPGPDQVERPDGRPRPGAGLAGDPGIDAGAAGDREGLLGPSARTATWTSIWPPLST